MAHAYWPLFDLCIRTPRLELRPPTDDDLVELAALAARGVHAPDRMPFLQAWALEPSPKLERGMFQWAWRQRAAVSGESWRLAFGVWVDGVVRGVQDLAAEQFRVTRSVSTGSWLGLEHQGQGIGREMRAAVLHLAFAGLDAVEAHSGAFEDNPASQRVSKAVGYDDNGQQRRHRGDGGAAVELRFRMSRDRWEEVRRSDIDIAGLEPCLDLLGLGDGPEPPPDA